MKRRQNETRGQIRVREGEKDRGKEGGVDGYGLLGGGGENFTLHLYYVIMNDSDVLIFHVHFQLKWRNFQYVNVYVSLVDLYLYSPDMQLPSGNCSFMKNYERCCSTEANPLHYRYHFCYFNAIIILNFLRPVLFCKILWIQIRGFKVLIRQGIGYQESLLVP